MNKRLSIEQGISDLVGVFTDPLIVYPGGWGDTLPDWLKGSITMERLLMEAKTPEGEHKIVGDAEACAYLYTASLTFPLSSDWTQIYLYVATQVCRRWRDGTEVPGDIAVESLTEDQTRDLNRLKGWLYRQRVKVREERDRAERRSEREATEARRKAERPMLFSF